MEQQQQWQHQWQKQRQRLQLVAAQCAQTSSAMSPQECRGVEGEASALITPSSIKRLSSCAQSPYATSLLLPSLSWLPVQQTFVMRASCP